MSGQHFQPENFQILKELSKLSSIEAEIVTETDFFDITGSIVEVFQQCDITLYEIIFV